MKIGVPKEIKNHEYRVGMIPAGVHALVASGHELLVQQGAGLGSGFADDEYTAAGARLVARRRRGLRRGRHGRSRSRSRSPPSTASSADGQMLFTYLHLAPLPRADRRAARARGHRHRLRDDHRRATGTLPLLTPMSEVAGRMAVQVGANYLQKPTAAAACCSAACRGCARRRGDHRRRHRRHSTRRRWRSGLGARVTVLEASLDRAALPRRRRSMATSRPWPATTTT